MNEIRKYRLTLDSPFFNNQGYGIALFDFFGTFLIAYIIEYYFHITNFLNISTKMYYMLLIPLGIIIHLLINQKTFLNTQLFNSTFNIYKFVFIIYVFLIFQR